MKCSAANRAIHETQECFWPHCWILPQHFRWDVTDFGLGDFARFGLTLVTLASEPEYCEKLMHAWHDQTTLCHVPQIKKEDIICRAGSLVIRLWGHQPDRRSDPPVEMSVRVDGEFCPVHAGECVILSSGSRVTLPSGIWHGFLPDSDECIIGKVSTVNDDHYDNVFANLEIGRLPAIDEDESASICRVSEG